MKLITIAGTVGKDAELRNTPQGEPVANFSVAVNDRKKEVTWFDVTLWGKRAEALAQYVTKGSKVTVMGDLQTREHNGKTYLQVSTVEIALQGSNAEKSGGGNSGGSYGDQSGGNPAQSRNADLDDEVPFAPQVR